MNFQRLFREEDTLNAKLEKSNESAKARGYASEYHDNLAEIYREDSDFLTFNRNRALNLQDFDYLFFHRDKFIPTIQTQFELIAAKIIYVKADGEDGYFKKLQKNVGWTEHITPLVICQTECADKLVRCGIWSNAKNSRRCHKPECPYCHWIDTLQVMVQAFGAESGTYARMQVGGLTAFFFTLGFTTNSKNSKFAGRDFRDKDIAYHPGDREYDPYPVRLGNSDYDSSNSSFGCLDAKILGMIAQKALEKIYNEGLLAGYHFKVEGAFKLVPGGANRVNLHIHASGNGYQANPSVLAKALFSEMRRLLRTYRRHKHLSQTYFPDVLVCRLNSGEEMERVIKYCEKVVPMGLIVKAAMNRPEARFEDGPWNPEYMEALRAALVWLVNDDIPDIFSGSPDPLFKTLRRRKSVGNMTFNDRGTCIGREPAWHKHQRRKRAADQRGRREKKRRENIVAQELELPRPARRRRRPCSAAPREGQKYERRQAIHPNSPVMIFQNLSAENAPILFKPKCE